MPQHPAIECHSSQNILQPVASFALVHELNSQHFVVEIAVPTCDSIVTVDTSFAIKSAVFTVPTGAAFKRQKRTAVHAGFCTIAACAAWVRET
jgi:hypothetical protein